MSAEEWRPVVGASDYEVSNLGRVFSRRRTRTGLIMRPCREKAGYLKVFIYGDDGTCRQRKVHHLVMEAFVGPRPDGLEVRHMDANRANNALTNLQYGTKTENAFDRVRHGNHPMVNKVQCVNGHEFTDDNIYWFGPEGRWRSCRACRRERSLRSKQRRAFRAAGIRAA